MQMSYTLFIHASGMEDSKGGMNLTPVATQSFIAYNLAPSPHVPDDRAGPHARDSAET